jgi:hypothetical protein
MRFIAEAGIEAYNYSTPLNLCFSLATDALTDVAEEISSEAAFR